MAMQQALIEKTMREGREAMKNLLDAFEDAKNYAAKYQKMDLGNEIEDQTVIDGLVTGAEFKTAMSSFTKIETEFDKDISFLYKISG